MYEPVYVGKIIVLETSQISSLEVGHPHCIGGPMWEAAVVLTMHSSNCSDPWQVTKASGLSFFHSNCSDAACQQHRLVHWRRTIRICWMKTCWTSFPFNPWNTTLEQSLLWKWKWFTVYSISRIWHVNPLGWAQPHGDLFLSWPVPSSARWALLLCSRSTWQHVWVLSSKKLSSLGVCQFSRKRWLLASFWFWLFFTQGLALRTSVMLGFLTGSSFGAKTIPGSRRILLFSYHPELFHILSSLLF